MAILDNILPENLYHYKKTWIFGGKCVIICIKCVVILLFYAVILLYEYKNFGDIMKANDYKIKNTFLDIYWLLAILHFVQSVLKHLSILDLDIVLSFFEALVFSLFLIMGVLCIYRKKDRLFFFASKDNILLIALFVLLVLSCIFRTFTSGNNYIDLNLSELREFIYLILYFNLGKISAKYSLRVFVIRTLHIVLISITAFMAIIVCYTTIYGAIETSHGGLIGMRDGYAFEVNCNPNYVGASSMILLLICLSVVIWYRKRKGVAIIYSICSVIHFIVLILSNSRTAFAATIVGISCIAGLLSFNTLYKNKVKGKLRISSEISILTGEIIFSLRYIVIYLYSLIIYLFNGFEFVIKEFTPEVVLNASSRLDIWGYCFKILFESPLILGLTPAGIAGPLIECDSLLVANPHSHNIVLEMGLAVGIPGMILFVIWLLFIAKSCITVLKSRPIDLDVMVIPFLILALVVDNMFERYVIFYGYFVSYIFFFLCGYISHKGETIDQYSK